MVLPQKETQSMSDQKAKKEFKSQIQNSSEVPRPCLIKSCWFTSSLASDRHSLFFLYFINSVQRPRGIPTPTKTALPLLPGRIAAAGITDGRWPCGVWHSTSTICLVLWTSQRAGVPLGRRGTSENKIRLKGSGLVPKWYSNYSEYLQSA